MANLIDKLGLYNYIKRSFNDIVIQNYYHEDFEMDFMKLTDTGLITEYELKISKGDYKADFLKTTFPGRWSNKPMEFKHDIIRSGKRCNRFFFVVPEAMVKLEECPKHCGLIYQTSARFITVKAAPILSKTKVEDSFYKHLCAQLSARDQRFRSKFYLMRKKVA